jgi:hypothetical protein
LCSCDWIEVGFQLLGDHYEETSTTKFNCSWPQWMQTTGFQCFSSDSLCYRKITTVRQKQIVKIHRTRHSARDTIDGQNALQFLTAVAICFCFPHINFVLVRFRVQFLAQRPAILTEFFLWFSSVLPGECWDKLGHDRFLLNPFQFIIVCALFVVTVGPPWRCYLAKYNK